MKTGSKYIGWIYLLTIDGKSYVGTTEYPKERFEVHMYALRKGNHPNKRMQEAYNRTHEYEFRILEETDSWIKHEYELDWIYRLETYLPAYGYNDADPRIVSYRTHKYTKSYWERMSGDYGFLYNKYIRGTERKIFTDKVILL